MPRRCSRRRARRRRVAAAVAAAAGTAAAAVADGAVGRSTAASTRSAPTRKPTATSDADVQRVRPQGVRAGGAGRHGQYVHAVRVARPRRELRGAVSHRVRRGRREQPVRERGGDAHRVRAVVVRRLPVHVRLRHLQQLVRPLLAPRRRQDAQRRQPDAAGVDDVARVPGSFDRRAGQPEELGPRRPRLHLRMQVQVHVHVHGAARARRRTPAAHPRVSHPGPPLQVPPGEEVYYRFARGKKNHAYTNKHASEINEGDGGSGGWIMHLENIPKECDESNFGLATLTSASGYTTPTLDSSATRSAATTTTRPGRLGLEDRHVPGLPREQEVRAGGRHRTHCPPPAPPPLPLHTSPPSTTQPPPPRRHDVLKARKIVALQEGIMRVPGTAVAPACRTTSSVASTRSASSSSSSKSTSTRAHAGVSTAQDHERRCPALLGAERAHGPDRVLRMSAPLPGGVAQRALWNGYPCGKGTTCALPPNRVATTAARLVPFGKANPKNDPADRTWRSCRCRRARGTCVCSSARTSPASP